MPAPLIVLVHGTMDRATSFAKVVRRLEGHELLTYDRPGYGEERERPPAATVADAVADLLARTAGRPMVVVGHSWGGHVGLLGAILRPDLVHAVGAFETPLPWQPWWPPDSAGGRSMTPGLSPEEAAERFMRGVVGDRIWERLPQATKEARLAEGPALVADMRAIRAEPPYDPAAVPVPVVVGSGGASTGHHRETTRRLAAEVPDGELFVIDGARHGAHTSHPDEFAAFVHRVLVRAADRGGVRPASAG